MNVMRDEFGISLKEVKEQQPPESFDWTLKPVNKQFVLIQLLRPDVEPNGKPHDNVVLNALSSHNQCFRIRK